MMLADAALVGMLLCAAMAVAARGLLASALWLAATSALLAVALYGLGAPYAGVVELSVGAGLVAVLFVFAIAIAGGEGLRARPIVPRPLAAVLVLLPLALVAALVGAPAPVSGPADATTFGAVFWGARGLDALLQLALLFAAVLGVLNLVGRTAPSSEPRGEPAPASAEPEKAAV